MTTREVTFLIIENISNVLETFSNVLETFSIVLEMFSLIEETPSMDEEMFSLAMASGNLSGFFNLKGLNFVNVKISRLIFLFPCDL